MESGNGRIVATLSRDVAEKLKADAVAEGRTTDEIADEAIMLRRHVRHDPSAASHYQVSRNITRNNTKIDGTHIHNNVQKTIHHAPLVSGSFNGWFSRWFERTRIWVKLNFPSQFVGGFSLGIFLTTYIFRMGGL